MNNERAKRKRIFYVPGMISLVLIPLFCFYHFYKVDAFKVYGSVNIYFPSDPKMIEKFLAVKRNYKLFEFNNSLNLESKKINDLQFALRKLNRENDILNGIQIHLGEKMKYEVYVRILEILELEQMPYYMHHKNNFFVLMMPKPKSTSKRNFVVCGSGFLAGDLDQEYFLEQERKAQFERNIALLKKNWILFLAYIGLAILNVVALVKFNKKKKYIQKDYI
jgi:hypothetical protein